MSSDTLTSPGLEAEKKSSGMKKAQQENPILMLLFGKSIERPGSNTKTRLFLKSYNDFTPSGTSTLTDFHHNKTK